MTREQAREWAETERQLALKSFDGTAAEALRVLLSEPGTCQADSVTRVEVIDETGRVFSRWNTSVEVAWQDNGRTLKVFVAPKPGGTDV